MNEKAELRVSVLLPLPLPEPYTYRVTADCEGLRQPDTGDDESGADEAEGQGIAVGDVVLVPLGQREVVGVVWSAGPEGDLAPAKLRAVMRRYDVPAFSAETRAFIDWVAAYTMYPRGSVLRMALSVPAALEPRRPSVAYRPCHAADPARTTGRVSQARQRVLAVLGDGPPRLGPELARDAGCGSGVIRAMVDAGLLEPVLQPAGTVLCPARP